MGRISMPEGGRKAFYAPTREEVARKIHRALHQIEQGLMPTDDRLTVEKYLDAWLAKTEKRVEPNAKRPLRRLTYRGYEQIVRLYLKPELGRRRLSKLTADDVEDFMDILTARGLSARTVQQAHCVLRMALKDALRRRLVHQNVATLVPAPTPSPEPVKPFSVSEAKAFMQAAKGHRFEALYISTLALGLRRGEVCGLKWADVDLAQDRLQVKRALQRSKGEGLVEVEPKSRNSRRSLPLPPFVVAVLKQHKRQQAAHRLGMGSEWRDGDWVFAQEDGRPLSPELATKAFPGFLADHKIRRIRFHDLRHSCASLLFHQGCPPRLVMEILGHSQIALTMNTYTHLLPGADRQAASAMQGLLGRD